MSDDGSRENANRAATQVYLQMLGQRYRNQMELSLAQMETARQIRDLIAAARRAPNADAMIRWQPDVRSLKQRLSVLMERRAADLIKEQVAECVAALSKGDGVKAEKTRTQLRQDLELLRGHAPIALRNGLTSLATLKQAITARPPAEGGQSNPQANDGSCDPESGRSDQSGGPSIPRPR